ncbi:hypothetical protein [Streptomyces sp. NPDC046942]|uniref:hypothetical protein n=1 Tax=Streptomyces sp. NPDC046942 TaxID=3155137 RepID=UPI0033DBFF16
MQRRGLVEREECETDRHGATFRLTSTGRTTIEQAAPGHVEAVRTLVFDALSSRQVTQLADLTGHLLHHLEAGRPAGPGKGPQQLDSAGQRVV